MEGKKTQKRVDPKTYTTQMKDPENILEIEDLQTCLHTDAGVVRAVDGVSFSVPAGKTVALVGESGCGKSITSLSVMQLLPRPQGKITAGSIRLNMGDTAWDIAKMPDTLMEKIRGDRVGMIFQEPMTALNPVFSVGKQIEEVLTLHAKELATPRARKQRVLELLDRVGIGNSSRVYGMYPHNLSGGMRQRVMIAIALACDPRLVIADEPTTALDVTVQAQILSLLKKLKEQTGAAVLLITHDLGVVAQMADQVVVMYAGRVVEQGTVREIFREPAHPYTIGLMKSRPTLGGKQKRLQAIGGRVPDPLDMPKGCYFQARCDHRFEDCQGEYPCQIKLSPTHFVSCYRSYPKEAKDE